MLIFNISCGLWCFLWFSVYACNSRREENDSVCFFFACCHQSSGKVFIYSFLTCVNLLFKNERERERWPFYAYVYNTHSTLIEHLLTKEWLKRHNFPKPTVVWAGSQGNINASTLENYWNCILWFYWKEEKRKNWFAWKRGRFACLPNKSN